MRRLRVVQWNVEKDHPVKDKVADIMASFNSVRPGWKGAAQVMGIQEGEDYAKALAERAHRDGHTLLWSDEVRGMSSNLLLVRKGVEVEHFRMIKAAKTRWYSHLGRIRPDAYQPVALVAGWLWVTVGHNPPAVKWKRVLGKWVMYGPLRRIAAFKEQGWRIEQFASHHPDKSIAVLKDWNCKSAQRGKHSPQWTAARTGGRIYASGVSTCDFNKDVDYALLIRARVDGLVHVAGRNGSDHREVWYTVTET